MPYGVILLPDVARSGTLVGYSQGIGRLVSPLMTLDERTPPHLTLLHVDGGRNVVDQWWEAVKTIAPESVPFKLRTLGFAPIPPGSYYVPEGGIYVGLQAIRDTTLDQLHRRVLTAARKLGLTTLGMVGDDFDPHITLGVLDRFPAGGVELDTVLPADLTGTVALGELGPYGTFPRILDHR